MPSDRGFHGSVYGRECRGFRMAPAERAVLDGEMTAADELQPRLHGHDSEAAQDSGCRRVGVLL